MRRDSGHAGSSVVGQSLGGQFTGVSASLETTSQILCAGSTMCAWPNLGSAASASTIGRIGRTPKPMSTTRCVGAVMLTETRGVLHGAQIPKTQGAGKYSDFPNYRTSLITDRPRASLALGPSCVRVRVRRVRIWLTTPRSSGPPRVWPRSSCNPHRFCPRT